MVQQMSRLPHDKLTFISAFLKQKKATLLELQQLVGYLNFACKVVALGRAFLHRLSSAAVLRAPHHSIRISSGISGDLEMWQSFFLDFNSVCVLVGGFEVAEGMKSDVPVSRVN